MRTTVLIAVLVLFGCALLWLAGSAFVSSVTTFAVRQEWPEGLGSADSVPRRYPPVETNDAARSLIPIAANLGVGMGRNSRGPETGPISDEASSYVSSEVARDNDAVQPPPAALGAFILAHETDFRQVENLIQHSPIVWSTHVEAAGDAHVPNLLGHLKLNRLLVARALARHDDPAAWTDLQASWILSRGLLRRPELISTLVGLSMARTMNAAARSLPAPAPQWRDEMARFDYRRALIASQQAEAWSVTTRLRHHSFVVDEDGHRNRLDPFHATANAVMTPFVDYAAAGLAKASRDSSLKLAGIKQCGMDGEAFTREVRDQIPRWNVIARVSNLDLGSVWQRVLRFRAELEETSRILQLKEHGWPASLPGVEQSQCSDGHWTYNGRSLYFSKELPLPRSIKAMPLRFTTVRVPDGKLEESGRGPRVRVERPHRQPQPSIAASYLLPNFSAPAKRLLGLAYDPVPMATMSFSTPAAVTSAPAPGPVTTSGFVL